MGEDIRSVVRDRYAGTARQAGQGGCGCGCGGASQSEQLGYERSELEAIPAEADLGLGCGNPTALAASQGRGDRAGPGLRRRASTASWPPGGSVRPDG